MNLGFNLHKIYFIISLKGNHLQAARDLFRNSIERFYAVKSPEKHEIENKEELFKLLDLISTKTHLENSPLIHIESHGLDSAKGLELNSGEIVYWSELKPYLTTINLNCCNNLSLAISGCNTVMVIEEMVQSFYDSLDAKVPFFTFVGTDSTINVDDLFNAFTVFYTEFAKNLNFYDSVVEMNKVSPTKFRTDNCYSVFKICVNKFADTWVKNRLKLIHEDPDLLKDLYCNLYTYTYAKSCDFTAIQAIMTDEEFYVDYFNKRMNEFLIVKECPQLGQRFPEIAGLNNFERSIPQLNLMRGI